MAKRIFNAGFFAVSGKVPFATLPGTIAAWLCPFSFSQVMNVISSIGQGNGHNLVIQQQTQQRIAMLTQGVGGNAGDTAFDPSQSLELNKWYHVTAVWESATLRKLYVNGMLGQTGTASNAPSLTGTLIWSIGSYNLAATNTFNGLMAEVAAWNVALNASEAMYLAGVGVDRGALSGMPTKICPSNLRCYFPLHGISPNAIDLNPKLYHSFDCTPTGTTGNVDHPAFLSPDRGHSRPEKVRTLQHYFGAVASANVLRERVGTRGRLALSSHVN